MEGVDRSLEGSQLQSPLVLLLLLQLEDMAGASFQTSLPGSGEEEEEEGQVLLWETHSGMVGTGNALTCGMSGRWVPEHQGVGGEAGEHRSCHHLINARLARELPANMSRGAVSGWTGTLGPSIAFPPPLRCQDLPPTVACTHPRVVCVGVQG